MYKPLLKEELKTLIFQKKIPLDEIDVSEITDMSNLFEGADFSELKGSLSNWNVSNVMNMSKMFANSSNFNQPLDNWNVSNVTDMSRMFFRCTDFNQSLNSWDVSKVQNMSEMFGRCENFNQSINRWNTSHVTDMHDMFSFCTNFNQSLNDWDVSHVTNMKYTFRGCINFNQSLNNWDIRKVVDLKNIFKNTQIRDFNFLRSWLPPTKISIEELGEIFGNLPLEWLVLKGSKSLTEKDYQILHPNCKNYLKYTIVDF